MTVFKQNSLGNDTVLLGESVDAIVRLSHPSDGAANGVRLEGSGHTASGLIDISDVNLVGKKMRNYQNIDHTGQLYEK